MNNNKIKYQVTTGVVLIIIGITLLSYNFINDKRDEVFSTMNLTLSEELQHDLYLEEGDTDTSVLDDSSNTDVVEDNDYEVYLAQMEIPKINFYKGFYGKDSDLNNVKFNLYVMPTSSYPDVEGGNLIIAGHSGNYNNSYFKDLYKLEINDNIYIYYNNLKYNYQVIKIYFQKKTGTISIYRNLDKTTLTLITCTKDDKDSQTVYIASLVGIE